MVTLRTQVRTEGAQLGKDPGSTEDAPLFYSIPEAGVRYYTYDCRPALQKMVARWAEVPGKSQQRES